MKAKYEFFSYDGILKPETKLNELDWKRSRDIKERLLGKYIEKYGKPGEEKGYKDSDIENYLSSFNIKKLLDDCSSMKINTCEELNKCPDNNDIIPASIIEDISLPLILYGLADILDYETPEGLFIKYCKETNYKNVYLKYQDINEYKPNFQICVKGAEIIIGESNHEENILFILERDMCIEPEVFETECKLGFLINFLKENEK